MRIGYNRLTDSQRKKLCQDIIAGFTVAYLVSTHHVTENTVYYYRARVFGRPVVNLTTSANGKVPKIKHPSEENDFDYVISKKQAEMAAKVPKTFPKPNALPWCTKELLTAGRARPARRRKEVAA